MKQENKTTSGKSLFIREEKSESFKLLELFKHAPVHYCTEFTSIANAMVCTYGKDIRRGGTLLQAVRVVRGSHRLNIHSYPLPTRATLPNRHSFAGKSECSFDCVRIDT
ncbi:hypothetical protein RF11_14136 [Thelohanellus kitauei]|uniref:Uncharacterized protein n=1 Tax=Thelohanellus kitauei TaxID=669202 RepID=A0A0C2MYG7_THEKT|nr:hypothetical protein RF11_02682 [Thelohanellus kitauei]KII72386.1 hypothetical protein RF11_14136 [Thelohanellus kitauei]